MPQPTLGDVHVNRPLTNISVAYSQEAAGVEFVADRAFPGDSRRKQKRPVLHLQARRLQPRRDAEARARDRVRGLRLRARFDRHVQLRRVGAAQGCGRPDPREQRLAALARSRRDHLPDQQGAHPPRERVGRRSSSRPACGPAKWRARPTSDSTHVVFWDYATSSPITDIRHAKTQARLNSGGFVPNIGVFSRPVFDKLVDHPDFIDRTKYGQTAPNPAMATRRIIAEILELEEVLVMDAVYNTAAEGATESNSFIGGLAAALFYRPRNAGLMTPSAGYTFNWTGMIGSTGGAGLRIKTFRMEHLGSDRVEIDAAFDMRLVSKDCGFFFNNVISAV